MSEAGQVARLWHELDEPPPVGPWLVIAVEHKGERHSMFGAYRHGIDGRGPPRFVGQLLDELEPDLKVTHYCRLADVIDRLSQEAFTEGMTALPYWSARDETQILREERLYMVSDREQNWHFAHWTAHDGRDATGAGVPMAFDDDGEPLYRPAFMLRKAGGIFLTPDRVRSFVDLESVKPSAPAMDLREVEDEGLGMR